MSINMNVDLREREISYGGHDELTLLLLMMTMMVTMMMTTMTMMMLILMMITRVLSVHEVAQ